MSEPIAALLQPMKDRLTDHAEGPWAHYVSPPEDQAKLIAAIEGVEALAAAWQARGEHLLEFSKTAPDDVSEALFTDAGSFLHTARLVRAALTQALGGDTA